MNTKKRSYSINFRTLLSIVIFSVSILLLLWIIQVLFLNIFYEKYQIKTVEKIAKDITKFGEDNISDELENISYTHNYCIEYINRFGVTISYNNKIAGCILNNVDKSIISYKHTLFRANKSVNAIKLINPINKTKTLLYAIKLDNSFVFINAPLEDVNSITIILRSQLIYVTFLAILLSCLIAYFISKVITSPILNITSKAKKIGEGEMVVFEHSGISEIDDLIDTLNYAQGELAKTDELRRDLLANVGHDLKTPLTMIKAYAEMIKDISYKNKAKREEHLGIIIKESDRLNILVNDILTLSKMQANADSINIESFDLTKEIQEIIKRYEIIKETEDYVFNIEVPEKMLVLADKNKINQVIYNLINNAINYTGENKTVTIRGSSIDDDYFIEIIDTGSGIKNSEIEYIWDKYYKKEKKHRRGVVGTGLGLSIVKTILIKHGFAYGVKSKLGKGTTFYFRIQKDVK